MAKLSAQDTAGYLEFFGSTDMIAFVEGVSALVPRYAYDPVFVAQIRSMIDDLFADLTVAAVKAAETANKRMPGIIEEERKRPKQHVSEDLADHIRSEPYPGLAKLGGVGIVELEEIEKVPYWRVIEEGSEVAYPGFVGRTLYGGFVDGAPREAPRAQYAGVDDPPHGAFVPGKAPANFPGGTGPGEIQHEIQPKHFIRNGANEAWAVYEKQIRRISKEYGARLLRIDGQRRRRELGRL